MSISELIAKRNADLAATAAVQPKILTGVEGSAGPAQAPTPPTDPVPDADDSLVKQYEGYPKGSYIMLRQKCLILKTGAKVMPDKNGVITPSTPEQEELLAYLLKEDRGLVAPIPPKL